MPRKRTTAVRGPCKYLRHHQQFGFTDPPVWKPVPADKRFELEAARVQHEWARQVRIQLRRLDLELEAIAEQVGITAEQLRRLLRGESALTLPRMLQISAAVGLDATVVFKAAE